MSSHGSESGEYSPSEKDRRTKRQINKAAASRKSRSRRTEEAKRMVENNVELVKSISEGKKINEELETERDTLSASIKTLKEIQQTASSNFNLIEELLDQIINEWNTFVPYGQVQVISDEVKQRKYTQIESKNLNKDFLKLQENIAALKNKIVTYIPPELSSSDQDSIEKDLDDLN